jgi:hypothetical protein
MTWQSVCYTLMGIATAVGLTAVVMELIRIRRFQRLRYCIEIMIMALENLDHEDKYAQQFELGVIATISIICEEMNLETPPEVKAVAEASKERRKAK